MTKEMTKETTKETKKENTYDEMQKQIDLLTKQNQIFRATIEKLKNVILSKCIEDFDKRCSAAQKQ